MIIAVSLKSAICQLGEYHAIATLIENMIRYAKRQASGLSPLAPIQLLIVQ